MLLKYVSIIEDVENLYKIYTLIKLCNKRNYYVSKHKTVILALVLINICKLLLALKHKYEYFFEIVDNYLRKI